MLQCPTHHIRRALIAIPVLLVVALVYVLYMPGLSGSLHFDDEVNLSGLSLVEDWRSGLQFAQSGWSAALGRSVSLASFALQAEDWGSNLQRLLRINIAIHSVNTALVGALAAILARMHPVLMLRTRWVAFFVMLFWGLLPLHASASLMLVQRMTTLSASFQLLALIGYAAGRYLYAARPRVALVMIGVWMPLMTLLATASKENGALIPLYCLILELTWFRYIFPVNGRIKLLISALLGVPALLITGYLLWVFFQFDAGYVTRDFTQAERLMTQPRVLVDYMRGLFMPRSSMFSPFHDDYVISRTFTEPIGTLFALLLWLAAIGCAWLLRARTIWPLFGLSWFLVGHVLESTVIPLELYFEHRNYLPALGPIFAIVAMGASIADVGRRRLAVIFGGIYASVFGFVLWATTSLWGDPLLASTLWLDEHPHSERAVIYAAQRQVLSGDLSAALRIAQYGVRENPESAGLAMVALQLACVSKDSHEIEAARHAALAALPVAPFSNAAGEALGKVAAFVIGGECPGVEVDDILHLSDMMDVNPRFSAQHFFRAQQAQVKAKLFIHKGDRLAAISSLQHGLAAYPVLVMVIDLAHVMAADGKMDAALEMLHHWRDHPPAQGQSHVAWRKEIDSQITKFSIARAFGRDWRMELRPPSSL